MKKEEMEDLVKLASQFGGNFSIGQYNEGNGVYVENVYTNNASDSKSEADGSFEPFAPSAPSASSDGDIDYPESPLDSELFNTALKMEEVKRALGRITSAKRDKGELKIVHWFIVWRVFRRYRFIPNDKTQTKFIQWAKNVFGWDWKTMDFKMVVSDVLKTIPLDKWTVSELSTQRPQAEEYLAWRDLIIATFLEGETDERRDCKEEFCNTWFDTEL